MRPDVSLHPFEAAVSSHQVATVVALLGVACASRRPMTPQPPRSLVLRTNSTAFPSIVPQHTIRLSCNRPRPGIVRIHPLASDTFGESGFYALISDGPDARHGFDTPIQLQLEIDPILSLNQPLPMRVSISNTSALRVEMAIFDAEDDPSNPPSFALYLRHEDTGVIYRHTTMGLFCGVVAASLPRILPLEPGQSADDLIRSSSFLREASIPQRGRYTAWIVYFQCSPPHPPRVHASNAARIEVR